MAGGRRAPVRRVVLVAAGRSGSTLLQSAFLASCERTLTFFEPCRHSPSAQGGDAVFREQCVPQVLRFLSCDLPQTVEGRWDPPRLRKWLSHPYAAANTSCPTPPFSSVAQMTQLCQRAEMVLVKEIRLVGKLSSLAAALVRHAKANDEHHAIIHLVRDPLPMLASQMRLHWWDAPTLGTRTNGTARAAQHAQHLQQQREKMKRVAKRTCRGMVTDDRTGRSLISAATAA